jgi:archaemetzincin
MDRLRPLHQKLGEPQPGDWLLTHPEPGQTFREYIAGHPVTPQGKRSVLYVQPLGTFSPTQRQVVTQTADFMGRYYNVQVKIQKDLPLAIIPAKARRTHPSWGMEQVLTGYVLDEVLKPRLPEDAAAYIAFTTSDLWPGEGWNFVFGQASLSDRVGAWSIYRNGNPEKNADEFRLCLLRTMKTAVHETGHMFSMYHCTAWECCMCGCNNREEGDRRPLALCPECVAKVWWATGADPVGRYRKLAEFCKQAGFQAEAEFYEKSILALTTVPAGRGQGAADKKGAAGKPSAAKDPGDK